MHRSLIHDKSGMLVDFTPKKESELQNGCSKKKKNELVLLRLPFVFLISI